MAKSRKIQDSLHRIRDVVMAQSAAMKASMEESHSMPPGYGMNATESYAMDGKRGPDGEPFREDTKKRRGVSHFCTSIFGSFTNVFVACCSSWAMPQL
jgi:hypothetical protein